jgi:hypothetical protein
MVIKVYRKTVTIPANAAWTRLDYLNTPTGVRRRLVELRAYWSATSGAALRLYWETEFVAELTPEVWNKYAIPYSFDLEVPAGTSIFIEGTNSTASAVTVTLEFIVDEACA